jgi:replicative DNA helicase
MSSRVEPPPHSATATAPTLAPHSQEAEEALIGSMLIDAGQFAVIANFLAASHFYILRNAWVWEAMERLHTAGDSIEFITVVNELRGMGRLEQIGGVGYLSHTIADAATAIHAEAYGQIVRRAYTRRQLLETANAIAQLARNEEIDITNVIQQAEGLLYEVTTAHSTTQRGQPQLLASIIPEYIDRAGEELDHGSPFIPTPYTDLNAKIGGLRQGAVYYIAGHSGNGKSALMTSIAKWQAEQGIKGLITTMEMSQDEHLERMTAMLTGISADTIARREFDGTTWEQLLAAWQGMGDSMGQSLAFWDTPTSTIPSLRRAIQQTRKKLGGLDVVWVDHLRLMESEQRTPNMADRVAEITRGLKNLAKSEQVAIVPLVQFNNSAPQSALDRPTIQYAYGGSSIKHDADYIFVLHRPAAFEDYASSGVHRDNEADLWIDKARSSGVNGQSITLFWDAARTEFKNFKRTSYKLD